MMGLRFNIQEGDMNTSITTSKNDEAKWRQMKKILLSLQVASVMWLS